MKQRAAGPPSRPVYHAHAANGGVPPHVPPVDVVDTGTSWRLVFEVPGAVADKTTVEVLGRVVSVRGERLPTDGGSGVFLRVERAAGPFERSVELPDDPDADGARASYADGLLSLEVPRRAASRSRLIPIQRGPVRRGTGAGGHGAP